MIEWSRAHDKLIAERCEGLRVYERTNGFGGLEYITQMMLPASFGSFGNTDPVQRTVEVPRYNTDIAACFRAAEAWRLQEPGRWYTVCSARDEGVDGNPINALAVLGEGYDTIVSRAETLHEALYEAVKDA